MSNTTNTVLEMTPSWEAILPMLCMCIVTENPKSPTQFEKSIAFQELRRMAKLADIGAQVVKLQRDAQEQGRIMHSPELGDFVR